MTSELCYSVPDMSCEHCRAAIMSALQPVAGVHAVQVDLAAKQVVVRGEDLNDAAIRSEIAAAGYEAK